MAICSVADLIDALRRFRLLETAQMQELTSNLQGRSIDVKSLARELVQRSWVTAYQVNRLFQDRGQDLVLGNYLILERLGEGGMGQVFKARQKSLRRTVALKVIRPERLSNPAAVRRFHR